MRRFIDYFSLRLIIFLASFIALSFVAKKFYIALLAALGITFALSIVIDLFMHHRTAHHMLYSQFLQRAIIGGNDYVCDLVLDTLHITSYRQEANYIITTYRGEDIIIINSIKFGIVTPDEMLRHQQLTHSKSITECYLLARIVDRRCLAIARHLNDFNIHLITTKQLYRLALKRSSHSDKKFMNKEDKPRDVTKFNIGDIFQILFARRNSSRYIITACILAFMSIFTPLRTYYLIMSSLTLLLSALCLLPISDYSSPTKLGIFASRSEQEEESARDSLHYVAQLMQPYPTTTAAQSSTHDDHVALDADHNSKPIATDSNSEDDTCSGDYFI